MNELIPIRYDEERPTVSARDLHEFLEVGNRFSALVSENARIRLY